VVAILELLIPYRLEHFD